MSKDTIVASVIGFGLGLVAAIALWVVPRLLPEADSTPTSPTPTDVVSISSTPTPEVAFAINQPRNGAILTEEEITITGIASESEFIVITSASSSNVVTPQNDGAFASSLTLREGGNKIVISGHPDTTTATSELYVFYYPEGI